MNTDTKLQIRDLVTIGVFLIIYVVAMYIVGTIGMVPVLIPATPALLGILTGPIVMLFMAKVQKPWALFILGILPPLLMFSMGHTYILFVHGLIVMTIAELLRRPGNYRSFKFNTLAFAVYNTWICGSFMQMLLVKEKYFEMSAQMMGEEYAHSFEKLITLPNMVLIYIGAIIGGIIGAYIGKALLQKHFKKAGIV